MLIFLPSLMTNLFSLILERFIITREGAERITALMESGDYEPVINGIRRVKRKFGNYSLSDLLHYVYKKFPDMTVESEIKEKVLRGR